MALKFTPKKIVGYRIRSFNPKQIDVWYFVDVGAGTCTCKQFEKKKACKHLEALGVYVWKPFTPKILPTFSQALCALVKAIRIRRVEEAVYWMVYMDDRKVFMDSQYRFRMARRLLIASSEDGHSIPVMEKVASNFPKLTNQKTDLLYLVAECLRICKLPNWWHPDSGGPLYVHQSMVGQRVWWQRAWNRTTEAAKLAIKQAIEAKDPVVAIGGLIAFGSCKEPLNHSQQAEFLLELAEEFNHPLAKRLVQVHLSARAALSGDNNFLCQAVWMMAGGVSPVAEQILPVTAGECFELITAAKEAWKTPHPVPTWACDGIHCAGNDTRFMGMFSEMIAVCKAFEHYGRIDPADTWLPEFKCFDGLQVQSGHLTNT